MLQQGSYAVVFTGDAMAAVPRGPQHVARRHYRDFTFPAHDFIEAVRPHPFLYDRNELDFKNTAKKEALWEAIGHQFGLSGNKAMSKWRNMRDTYFKIRKQELLDRRLKLTPQFRRPAKTWPLYHKMRQIFGVKQSAAANASAGGGATGGEQVSSDSAPPDSQAAATSQTNVVTVLPFDPAWMTTNGVEVRDPELSSINAGATLHLDNGATVSVKQEPPEEVEMTISEHEASAASGCEDSEHEDESTLASLEKSITVARALCDKRRKDFQDAVEDFEGRQQPLVFITSPSLPIQATLPERGPGSTCAVGTVTPPPKVVNTPISMGCEAQTQTPHPQQRVCCGPGSASGVTENVASHSPVLAGLSTPSATASDGLEHFGLFVAHRLRMTNATTQARLMSIILKLVLDPQCPTSD